MMTINDSLNCSITDDSDDSRGVSYNSNNSVIQAMDEVSNSVFEFTNGN